MKKRCLLWLCFCSYSGLFAQSRFDVLPYWKYYQAKTPQTYHVLMDQALAQLADRKARVDQIKTAAAWQSYREQLRAKMVASLGGFPERTPLNANVTTTFSSGGVKVENLLYESLPGYFVSASFFKRDDLKGKKLPVIVYCSGHSANGYRSAGYQQIILNYVRKGFAVLAFDPIGQGERVQYRNADGKAALGPTHDHSYSGSKAFLLGHSPAKYFIWDGIRAIDYLETRPDVDMTRVGIAGRSGGGTQSSYIAALDERVAAAAPECYITTYEMLLKSKGPQDAEQILLNGIAEGIDIPDLLHIRAPKPTLVVTTTNDMFSVQGAHDMKRELADFYKMAGKAESFDVVEDNAAHAPTKRNREACYRFFSKHLRNPCNTEEEVVTAFKDEQLFAAGGDVFGLPGSKRLDEVIAASMQQPAEAGTDVRKSVIKTLNYTPGNPTGASIFSGTILATRYTADKYLVEIRKDAYLPVVVFTGKSVKGTVLYLDEQGKTADTTVIEKLVERFGRVVCADLSGMGELREFYNWQGDAYIKETPLNLWYLGLLTRQTLAGHRLNEIDALYAFIRGKKWGGGVSGFARGGVTTDLLHWAVVHSANLENLMLVNPILSYRSLVNDSAYRTTYLLHAGGGMLQHYDLPDLYRAIQSGSLRLVNPVDSRGEALNSTDLNFEKGIPDASLVFDEDPAGW